MSEKSVFNTISPKGSWTFGIGLMDLKLIFLACINDKYCNLKAFILAFFVFLEIWHVEVAWFFTNFDVIRDINNHYFKTLRYSFHMWFGNNRSFQVMYKYFFIKNKIKNIYFNQKLDVCGSFRVKTPNFPADPIQISMKLHRNV